jgi:hypothetical protein
VSGPKRASESSSAIRRAGLLGAPASAASAGAPAVRDGVATPRHLDTETSSPPAVSGHRDTVTPQQRREPASRFTVRFFDADEALGFDQWCLEARRELGHRVDKAEVVRLLVGLVRSDPYVRDQVLEALRRQK